MPSSLAHGRVGAPEGQVVAADPRRAVPRTDVLLTEPRIAAATERLGRSVVKAAVGAAQDRARRGEIAPSEVADAAARVLAATALARGREMVISRGELVEIGDGFRLPDLLVATGARIREVGTTNRTVLGDYADAIGPDTAFVLKVHPANFRVEGFTAAVDVRALATLGAPVVVDVGSGLLRPDPLLPAEPTVAGTLRAGAVLVTASGDKLLGGPQAGLVLGDAALVAQLRRRG